MLSARREVAVIGDSGYCPSSYLGKRYDVTGSFKENPNAADLTKPFTVVGRRSDQGPTSLKMHVESALRKTKLAKSFEAEAEAAKAKAAAASSLSSSSAAAGVQEPTSPPKQAAAPMALTSIFKSNLVDSDDDDDDDDAPVIVGQEPAAEEAPAPWTKEIDDFALLVKANWHFAVDDEAIPASFVFWANAGIIRASRCTLRLPARTSQGWLRRPTASVSSATPAGFSLISASQCRRSSLRLTLLATRVGAHGRGGFCQVPKQGAGRPLKRKAQRHKDERPKRYPI